MNVKEKTTVISIILKVIFTVFKFIAYYFTGSMAIFAEACHSFTDIITSVFVYLSVKKRSYPEDTENILVSGSSNLLWLR